MTMSKEWMLIVVLLIFLTGAGATPARTGDDVRDLKKQIETLQKKIDQLEAQSAQRNSRSRGFLDRGDMFDGDFFKEMERIQGEMNKMFQGAFTGRGQASPGSILPDGDLGANFDLGVQDLQDRYTIILDLKGLDQNHVDVQINESSVTVKGQYSREDKTQGPGSFYSSSGFGSFLRTIPLPVDADTSKTKTEKKGDSLVITIPKK